MYAREVRATASRRSMHSLYIKREYDSGNLDTAKSGLNYNYTTCSVVSLGNLKTANILSAILRGSRNLSLGIFTRFSYEWS